MDQSESGKSQYSVLIESLALSNVTRKYLKHVDPPSPEVKHLDLFGKFMSGFVFVDSTKIALHCCSIIVLTSISFFCFGTKS